MKSLLLSCCLLLTIALPGLLAQQEVVIDLGEEQLGSTNAAVPVLVSNFETVAGIQLTFGWQANQLTLDSAGAFGISNLQAESFNINNDAGTLRFIWSDNNANGLSLPDSTPIFSLFFSAGPAVTDTNLVEFLPGPTPPVVAQFQNNDFVEYAPSLLPGQVQLRPPLSLLSFELNDPSCQGEADGSILVMPQGGLPPYTYQWDGVEGGPQIEGLEGGNYQLVITDEEGITAVANFLLVEPEALSLAYLLTEPSCEGATDGILEPQISGGTSPYEITLNDQFLGNPTFIEIASGNYTLTVVDDNDCSTDTSLEVDAAPLVQETSFVAPSCNGDTDGSITLETLDLPGIAFAWSNGASTNPITNLTAGNYDVTVTSTGGCQTVESFELEEPPSIEANVTIRYGCGDGFVRLTANPSGSDENFTYSWSNGSTTNVAFQVTAGTYSVSLTDQEGCTGVETVEVDYVPPFEVISEVSNVSCFNANNGSIALAISGSIPPYDIQWNDGSDANTRTDLAAGEYSVNISSASGCNYFESFTVNEATALDVTVIVNDVTDGLYDVSAIPFGGVPPYQINWSTGETTLSVLDLPMGGYEVSISDGNGCFHIEFFNLGNTATNAPSDHEFRIYPNPSRGQFILEGIPEEAAVQLFDLQGQALAAEIMRMGDQSLKVKTIGVIPKVGILIIRSGDHWWSERIIFAD